MLDSTKNGVELAADHSDAVAGALLVGITMQVFAGPLGGVLGAIAGAAVGAFRNDRDVQLRPSFSDNVKPNEQPPSEVE
ncbi:MAG: hypothetical protein QOE82_3788 [Thermoanaerobaculia bacterium]|jgi:hypothetical protein|nr:hypothetical protein [Thermoanaerobaculia bacterium]